MVYLDYAATAPMRREALEAMLPLLKENFGNPDSPHAFGRRAAYAVTEARAQIAEILGVRTGEVYFTSGGTEADNWAVRCLGRGGAAVSAIEHAAVLEALPHRGEKGQTFPVSKEGIAEHLPDFGAPIGLVCCMAVNNETGCIQPIETLAAETHERGALFFSDCVQAACSQPLDQILKHADAISLSAHKIGGPKGVGALIVKGGAPLSPLIAGGEQERGLRGGTLNAAGIVGFAAALSLAVREREAFCAHTAAVRAVFEEALLGFEGIFIDGDHRAPNISHVTLAGGGGHVLDLLDLKGVAASGGAACSAHAGLPSHVLLAMGRTEEEAKKGVRFSFGMQTTKEEALFAARTLLEILKG